MNLNKNQLNYLAGFVDGEGTISIVQHPNPNKTKSYWQGYLNLSNTNKEVMETIGKWLNVKVRATSPKNPKHSVYYEIKIRRNYLVLKILKQIYPFLIVKKDQAKLVMEYLEKKLSNELTSEEEASYVEKIRRLNRKKNTNTTTEKLTSKL